MKIALIVGARPQFIKAAPLEKALRKSHRLYIIHTGQHYDFEMSEVFFSEMRIPAPDVNLGVGSNSPGRQTAAMLVALEKTLAGLFPDLAVVFGDTNSTLAGALAAARLGIPLAHVEAGLRSFNRAMPEEINRVVTDQLSSYLFCPTPAAVANLKREGIGTIRQKNLPRVSSSTTGNRRFAVSRIFQCGDVMADTLETYLPRARRKLQFLTKIGVQTGEYILLTIHRAGNTDVPGNLENILGELSRLKKPVVFPAHPRTIRKIKERQIPIGINVKTLAPVSYLEMLCLEANAEMIVTDSGGVQKEAYLLRTPCVTLREETEWVETVESGWNQLAGVSPGKISRALKSWKPLTSHPDFYGRGDAAIKIAEKINRLT